MLLREPRTQGVISEVPAHSDPCALDELLFLLRKRRSVELCVIHIALMDISGLMPMVVLDHLVKEAAENFVGVMASCVDANP